MSTAEKARGALLGLACGDALGRPVEFRSEVWIRHEFGRLNEMVGNGTHFKPPGTVTDDTELALRIGHSLVDREGFDGEDVAERFLQWYRSGPFDIGRMTADSLRRIEDGTPWDEAGEAVHEERREGQNAGNGSVMRCVPHAVAFSEDRDRLVTVSRTSSRITHADPRCSYGCAVLNLTIAGLIHGENDPLRTALDRVRPEAPTELVEALERVAEGERIETLENSGYVVHTLQTALHDAFRADDAEAAIVTAVNRGGDTDTIGAVAGAVAGARFGAQGLPERWLETIDEQEELASLAAELRKV